MTLQAPPMRFWYEVQPDEKWTLWQGVLIVTHPARPPKMVYSDENGEIVEEEITIQ